MGSITQQWETRSSAAKVSEGHFSAFPPMQQHHCMLTKLHVDHQKLAAASRGVHSSMRQ